MATPVYSRSLPAEGFAAGVGGRVPFVCGGGEVGVEGGGCGGGGGRGMAQAAPAAGRGRGRHWARRSAAGKQRMRKREGAGAREGGRAVSAGARGGALEAEGWRSRYRRSPAAAADVDGRRHGGGGEQAGCGTSADGVARRRGGVA